MKLLDSGLRGFFTSGLVIFAAGVLPAFGATDHLVQGANSLTAVAANLAAAATTTPGLHTVTLGQYRAVGTFNFNGTNSRADTIQFRRAKNSDSVLEVTAANPLIRIRNWRTTTTPRVLRFSNLAFHWSSPTAVLIDGNDSLTLGSLIIDSCVIYADTMSSSFIQWLAGTGMRIEIKRSYIVSRSGRRAILRLEAPTVSLNNNVLNFPGILQTKSALNFNFSNNTVNRMQINANGGTALPATAVYTVLQNLIACPAGPNYAAVLPTDSATYFMAIANFKVGAGLAQNNRIYGLWKGGFEYPNVHFLDASNIVIASPPLQPDTTELWRWNVTGYTGYGALAGDSARPNPYNVFPADTTASVVLPDNTPARFTFRVSTIPRTLKPAFTGEAPPDQGNYPAYLFPWQGRGAVRLDGPFRVNSIWLNMKSSDGNPVLFSKLDTGVFQLQTEGTLNALDTTQFGNRLIDATQFHAAFRCNTRSGTAVRPTYEMGLTATADTLQFNSITRPGRTLWAVPVVISTSTLAQDVRLLGHGVSYTTTAVPTTGTSLLISTSFRPSPYLTDSLKLLSPATGLLYGINATGKFTVPATTLSVQMAEHLSVPRGGRQFSKQVSFPFGWGFAKALSDTAGFQMWLDSVNVGAVDTTKFGFATKPVRVRWPGRAVPRDSVWLQAYVPTDLELWKVVGAGTPTLVTTAARKGDSLALPLLLLADSTSAFFRGLSYNIPVGTFTGAVNGFQVEGLKTALAGRLDLSALSPANADTIPVARYAGFLGGASISMRHLQLQGTAYALSFSILTPQDTAHVRVYTYSMNRGWQPSGFSLLSAAKTARIAGLDSSVTRVLVLEVVGLPKNITVTPIISLQGDSARVTFSNTVSPGANTAINGYQVELLGVNPQGEVVHRLSTLSPLATPIVDTAATHDYNTFSVRYFVNGTLVGIIPLGGLQNLQVSKAQQEAARGSNTLPWGWQIAGLPMEGGGVVSSHFTPADAGNASDQRQTWLLDLTNGQYTWDAGVATGYLATRGQGVLFGGNREYKTILDAAIPVNLDTFALSSAIDVWKLIANPYPFPIRMARLRSNKGPLSSMKQLTLANAGPSRQYVWKSADTITLRPFTGYAYFFRAGEVLTFDPLMQTVMAKRPASTSASPLVLNLQSVSGSAQVALFPQGGGQNIPALPSPGKTLDIRIGGGSGFWKKGVAWDGFREQLVVTSPASGAASLSMEAGVAGEPHWALLDSLSGAAYSGVEFQNLPVREGDNHFLLIGGSADFVAQNLNQFHASHSSSGRFSIRVSHGVMDLDLDLPPSKGGYSRLEISLTDARGRRMLSQAQGRTAAGTQQLHFALPSMLPGLYFCRAQARAEGGGEFHAVRKMVVTP